RVAGQGQGQGSGTALAQLLAGRTDAERMPVLVGLVRTQVAAVLGHAGPEAIEPGRAFQELAFDSLSAVEFRNQMQVATGLRLPAPLVSDHPSAQAGAAHLDPLLEGSAATTETAVAVRGADDDEPIAIVAMACRYPGGVASPEDLWRLVAGGVDAVTE